jgi:hypothetical protein
VREHPGARIALLEARTVGDGATGKSTGVIGPGVGSGILGLRSRWGDARATAMFSATMDAVDLTLKLVQNEGIECHLENTSQVVAARTRLHARKLRRQATAFADLGFDVPYLGADELADIVGTECYLAGIRCSQVATVILTCCASVSPSARLPPVSSSSNTPPCIGWRTVPALFSSPRPVGYTPATWCWPTTARRRARARWTGPWCRSTPTGCAPHRFRRPARIPGLAQPGRGHRQPHLLRERAGLVDSVRGRIADTLDPTASAAADRATQFAWQRGRGRGCPDRRWARSSTAKPVASVPPRRVIRGSVATIWCSEKSTRSRLEAVLRRSLEKRATHPWEVSQRNSSLPNSTAPLATCLARKPGNRDSDASSRPGSRLCRNLAWGSPFRGAGPSG